MPVQTEGMP